METTYIEDGWIGKTLGRCKLLRKLGEGGMGAVYLAHHTGLDIPVAVKLLAPAFASREDWRARFQREARVAARLDHANAVRVLDVSTEDDTPYLVMEFVDGASLGQCTRETGLGWAEALVAVRQAADALAAAHALGLIHRDVKPDNLMRAKDGTVKVADFGLARQEGQGDLTRTGGVAGSPPFMSPEQCDGQPLDGKTDVFSLGVTFYALLTGKSPFERTSFMTTLRAVFDDDLPPLPDGCAPRAIGQLIDKMCVKDAAGRPTMAQVLATLRKLESKIPGMSARARPKGAPAKSARPRKPSRAPAAPDAPAPRLPLPLLGAVGAALVVVVLLLAAVLGGGDGGGDGDGSDAGSGSALAAGSGSGSTPTVRRFEAVAKLVEEMDDADAVALLETYVASGPPPLDRRAAASLIKRLKARIVRTAYDARLRPLLEADDLSGVAAALADAPDDEARSHWEGELSRAASGALAGRASAVSRHLDAGELAEARAELAAAAKLEAVLDERGRARLADLRERVDEAVAAAKLLAAGSGSGTAPGSGSHAAGSGSAATPRTWGEALDRALAQLDRSDPTLTAMVRAHGELLVARAFAADRDRRPADPRWVEIEAVAKYARYRIAFLGRRRGTPITVPATPPVTGVLRQVTNIALVVETKAGERAVPWRDLPWSAFADVVAADAPSFSVGPALWALGEHAAARQWLRRERGRAGLADYIAARKIALDDGPPVRPKGGRGEALDPPPGRPLKPLPEIRLRATARKKARAEAAKAGRIFADGYALTPAQWAGALTPTWTVAHEGGVRALAVLARKGWLLAGGGRRVSLIELKSGKHKVLEPFEKGSVTAVGWDRWDRPLAAVGRDLHAWTGSEWMPLFQLGGDIRRLVSHPTNKQYFAVSGREGRVAIIRQTSKEDCEGVEWLVEGHARALAWFAKGRGLLIGTTHKRLYGYDTDGEPLWEVELPDAVESVALSADGKHAFTGVMKRALYRWQLGGKPGDHPAKPEMTLLPGDPTQPDVAVGPAGVLAVAGNAGHVSLIVDGAPVRAVRYSTHEGRAHPGRVLFARDGMVTAGADGRVIFWTPSLRSEPTRQIGAGGFAVSAGLFATSLSPRWEKDHPARLTRLVVDPDGRWVAVGSLDGTVSRYSLATGELLTEERPLGGREIVGLGADGVGTLYAAAKGDARLMRRAADGSWTAVLTHDKPLTGLDVRRDGTYVLIASAGQIRIVRTRDWKPEAFINTRAGGGTQAIALRPDRMEVAARHAPRLLARWGAGMQAPIWRDDQRSQQDYLEQPMAYAPDGAYLAIGGYRDRLRVLDTRSGEWAHQRPLLFAATLAVDFGPAGSLLAASTHDNYQKPYMGWLTLTDTASWLEAGRLHVAPQQRLALVRVFRGGVVCGAGRRVTLLVAAAPRAVK